MKIIVLLFVVFHFLRGADATIEVAKGVTALPKLAVEDGSFQPGTLSRELGKMLVTDMEVVSLFNVDGTYAAAPYDSLYPSALHKEAQYILRYRLSHENGSVRTDIKLLQNGTAVFAKSYFLQQPEMMVFLAHTIAYDINSKLGGSPMEWMKRKVLFVRLTSPRHSEIVAADYTLSYQRVILSGGLYGFAKWANRDQTDLYYTSLGEHQPTIYKMNLLSGRREKVISSDGMAVCSDASADGSRLLLTLAPSGQPDIYLYDTRTRAKTRLTDYPGIDVNGQFLGNGEIAFISNRLGYPNVFAKKIGATAVRQLVFQGKNNSSLTTHNNVIVYKAREKNGNYSGNSFNLHLLSLNSGHTKRMTASGENDFPRFSPDGDAILFIKQENARSSVGIIRTGVNKSFAFPLRAGKIQSIDW